VGFSIALGLEYDGLIIRILANSRLLLSYYAIFLHVRPYHFFKPVSARSLRARAHNFVLPPKDNRNFVSRALY